MKSKKNNRNTIKNKNRTDNKNKRWHQIFV